MKGFSGDLAFLSNFQQYQQPIKIGKHLFNSNEKFYQCCKLPQEQIEAIANESRGLHNVDDKLIKRLGKPHNKPLREITIEDIRLRMNIMLYGLLLKFDKQLNPTLNSLLLSRNDFFFIEWNTWGDSINGVDEKNFVGDNIVGKLITYIRNYITGIEVGKFQMEIENILSQSIPHITPYLVVQNVSIQRDRHKMSIFSKKELVHHLKKFGVTEENIYIPIEFQRFYKE